VRLESHHELIELQFRYLSPRRAVRQFPKEALEKIMSEMAKGTFEVKAAPVAADSGDDSGIGRLTLDKKFSGDLEGTSRGQMLGFRSATDGSAGYVAMEKVTAKLGGRRGSFVLQHTGTMTRNAPSLNVTIVPDSGTGEFTGISGTMTIIIAEGKHNYEFAYKIG
jgi:uncharacterized protein DUF3224